jgi:uncharacterized membrane protein
MLKAILWTIFIISTMEVWIYLLTYVLTFVVLGVKILHNLPIYIMMKVLGLFVNLEEVQEHGTVN